MPALNQFTFVVGVVLVLASLSPTATFAQQGAAPPRGLLVYKDPLTKYVEVFEYSGSRSLNSYTTRYLYGRGITRDASYKSVVEDIAYPDASGHADVAQLQANLQKLDVLIRQYPQYSTLLNSATARLRASLTVAQARSRVPAAASSTPTSPASSFPKTTDPGPPAIIQNPILPVGPVAPAIAGLKERSAKSAQEHSSKLTQEEQAAQADIDRISHQIEDQRSKIAENQDNVREIGFIVQRKLNPAKFGGDAQAGIKLYQIKLFPLDDDSLAILKTSETRYTTTGRSDMYVAFEQTMPIEMMNGSSRDVPVFTEVPQTEIDALIARKKAAAALQAGLDDAKRRVDDAKHRHQVFDYATKQFLALNLAPMFHLSNRLQILGFKAQVTSAQWNDVLTDLGKADWDDLAEVMLGTKDGMNSTEVVDATSKRIATLGFTVSLRSDQVQIFVQNKQGYLERPGQHRAISVGSLSLPAQPERFVSETAFNGLMLDALPDIHDLHDQIHPSGDGFVAAWTPATTDMYFFVNVLAPEQGEKTAARDLDALVRSIQADALRIRHEQEAGKFSPADRATKVGQAVRGIFDYARGPLMTSY